jgi:hypothetical protein
MATSEQPRLNMSEDQLAELEKLARAQDRSVSDVVSEAVDRYIKEKQWQGLKRYGRAKARELGLTEADVPRLIEESRQERGR